MIVFSKIVKIHKARTGHGNECGRIQINAESLTGMVGEEVFIIVTKEE